MEKTLSITTVYPFFSYLRLRYKKEESKMQTIEMNEQVKKQFGITTKILAGVCHKCEICPFADKKPDSVFGRIMHWHRTWCPAWAAHTKIYGRKLLS